MRVKTVIDSYIEGFHAPFVKELLTLVKAQDINCIGLIFPNQGPVGVVQLRGVLAERIAVPTVIIRINERLVRNQVWFERSDTAYPPLSPKSKVMLLGDAATSGASIYCAALIVRKFGAICEHAFVVFDRLQGASERLDAKRIKLFSFIDRNFFESRGELNQSDISHDGKASRFEFESVRAII